MTLLHQEQEQEKQEDQCPFAEEVNIVDYTETQNDKMLSSGDGDDDVVREGRTTERERSNTRHGDGA